MTATSAATPAATARSAPEGADDTEAPPAHRATVAAGDGGAGGSGPDRSWWRDLVARVPTEEVPALATGMALLGLVALVALGRTTPTTGLTLAVVVIGLRTVVDARSGAMPTGLVALGTALALLLAACWWAGTDLDERPEWTTERPTEALAAYEVAAGNLTIDLTESPRPVGVRAEVGAGRVVVRVPDADVRAGRVLVRARVAGGWADVPVPRADPIRPIGRDAGAAVLDEVATRPAAEPTVVVEVAVGVGSVKVDRVR